MDYLWTPWRHQYIASLKNPSRCVFCIETSCEHDERDFVVFRGKSSFVILNIFPYTTGHLLVAPYAHTADFQKCTSEESAEMIELVKRCQFAQQLTHRLRSHRRLVDDQDDFFGQRIERPKHGEAFSSRGRPLRVNMS